MKLTIARKLTFSYIHVKNTSMDSKKVVTSEFNIVFLYMCDLVVETMPKNCADKKFIGRISNNLLTWIITYYTHDPKCGRLILRDSSNIAFDLPREQEHEIKQSLGQYYEQTWKEGSRLSVHTHNFLTQEYIINLIIGIGFSWTPMVTKICIC